MEGSSSLARLLTLHFSLRTIQRLEESDVIKSLYEGVDKKEIQTVQLTRSECRVTLTSEKAKSKLKLLGVSTSSSIQFSATGRLLDNTCMCYELRTPSSLDN